MLRLGDTHEFLASIPLATTPAILVSRHNLLMLKKGSQISVGSVRHDEKHPRTAVRYD